MLWFLFGVVVGHYVIPDLQSFIKQRGSKR